MKKQKMTLGQLKVQSFLTSFEDNDGNTVKGGSYDCPTDIRPLCSRFACSEAGACLSDNCPPPTGDCTPPLTIGCPPLTQFCPPPTVICVETRKCAV